MTDLADLLGQPYDEQCQWCGKPQTIVYANGPHVGLRCGDCGRHNRWVSKAELGLATRSTRTRPDIKPSQRARILERDNGTCVVCHDATRPIHIGHLLSVDAGRRLEFTDAELYDDENLAAMCEECNAGLGDLSVSLRMLAGILRARIKEKPLE